MFGVIRWQAYLTGAAALVALAAGIWGHGWHTGSSGERARWQARTAALRVGRTLSATAIAGQAQMLAKLAADRDALAEQLEREAHEDDTADRPAFGPDAVLRLNRR